MALLGPTQEDLRKIHAEVNQLVNQRFLLTTLAITVFGVVIALLVPRTPPTQDGMLGGFVLLLAALLSVLLFALFLLSHLYKGMIRVFTTYLKVTGASNWEKDWGSFRQSPYLGYTKPQTLVFLILNLLTIAYPFLMAWVYNLRLEPRMGLIALLTTGSLTELLMVGMGFWNWWDRERKAEQQWKAIKSD
jgi:hypothetical protein